MSDSSTSQQGFSPQLLPTDDDLTSDMSRVVSTHSIMAEAANLPPAIPPFGTSPVRSFGRGSVPNNPVDIAEQLFSAHGSPVPSNSVAAYENGLINLPEQQVARVVKEHLLLGSPKLSGRASPSIHSVPDSDVASNTGHSSAYDDFDAADYQAAVHQLPGGSIVDGIYKWAANVESQQVDRRKRSKSFSSPAGRYVDEAIASDIRAPGGFRRHYVMHKAAELGKAPPNYITKNFFDFLCLYGNFGGEDLHDDEGYKGYEEEEDEEETTGLRRRRHDENTPLLPKHNQPPQGTATPSKAVFLLLKSFVGTGMLGYDPSPPLHSTVHDIIQPFSD
jgi:proton-coupled amino acid transporter